MGQVLIQLIEDAGHRGRDLLVALERALLEYSQEVTKPLLGCRCELFARHFRR